LILPSPNAKIVILLTADDEIKMSCECITPERLIVAPFRQPTGEIALVTGAIASDRVYVEGDILVGTVDEIMFAKAFFGLQTGASVADVPIDVLEASLRVFSSLPLARFALHRRMLGKLDRKDKSELGSVAKIIDDYLHGDRSDEVRPFGGVIVGSQYRWPNKTVPYLIDGTVSDPSVVTGAIDHWTSNTSLQFVNWDGSATDYVLFTGGNECSSSIGRQGGKQLITIGNNCSKGNAIHEIGHTVGLYHEQNRSDRDVYVDVEWSNIKDNYKGNYTKYGNLGMDVDRYDYGSIMHYPKFAPDQAIDPGQPVLVPTLTDPEPPIGQRVALSAGDISAVAYMYP
jgi:astacin (peptidase family M12A)